MSGTRSVGVPVTKCGWRLLLELLKGRATKSPSPVSPSNLVKEPSGNGKHNRELL